MTPVSRTAGWCLVAAGVLIAPTGFHPDIFDVSLAEASGQRYWAAGHATGVLAMVLSLYGVAGLAARFGARLGVLGRVGLLLTIPGIVATAIAAYIEAFLLPPLARVDPGLVDVNGPLFGSTPLRLLGAVALLWLVGLALVGAALWRARLVSRGAAGLLAVGAVAFGAFEGPFVPVLGVLSVIVFAAGYVWTGVAVMGSGD
ncbi:MAG TPA: hypothetical protein VFJ97_05190 [Dermatophilaceae bacterium]|nr:hypothetical protein [Dermatophilaceae bacterium]